MPMNCSGNWGLVLKLQNYCFVCLSVGANNIKTFFYEKAGVTLIGSWWSYCLKLLSNDEVRFSFLNARKIGFNVFLLHKFMIILNSIDLADSWFLLWLKRFQPADERKTRQSSEEVPFQELWSFPTKGKLKTIEPLFLYLLFLLNHYKWFQWSNQTSLLSFNQVELLNLMHCHSWYLLFGLFYDQKVPLLTSSLVLVNNLICEHTIHAKLKLKNFRSCLVLQSFRLQ